MLVIDEAGVDRALDFPRLIDALHATLCARIALPVRKHYTIQRPEGDAAHLSMPAWHEEPGGYLGVKLVNVFPGNAARGLPSVMGSYVLMDGDSGAPLAVIDGTRLTLWKTAAASALAARHLAAPNAQMHLMVGAGALAPWFIRAMRAVRPISRTLIWNRNRAGAERLAATMRAEGFDCQATTDLEGACRQADIISTATMSKEPLVRGAWLKPGCHLDLVGAYTPEMRESDDEAVKRARLFCDIRDSALKEGGDLIQPMRAGLISEADIEGDLFDLCRGKVLVNRKAEDITLFKSAGSALLDLGTAGLIYANSRQNA